VLVATIFCTYDILRSEAVSSSSEASSAGQWVVTKTREWSACHATTQTGRRALVWPR